MLINTIKDLRIAARNPYAWPGGYPTFLICDDGGALCHACLSAERRQIIDSVANKRNDGWRVVGLDVNWEDASLFCANCDEQIPSAYGDDNNP